MTGKHKFLCSLTFTKLWIVPAIPKKKLILLLFYSVVLNQLVFLQTASKLKPGMPSVKGIKHSDGMNHEWQACISAVDNSDHKVRWILDMKWINDWFYFHNQCYKFVHEQILQWVLYFKTSFWNYHRHSSSQTGNILRYTRWSVIWEDGCIRKEHKGAWDFIKKITLNHYFI